MLMYGLKQSIVLWLLYPSMVEVTMLFSNVSLNNVHVILPKMAEMTIKAPGLYKEK